MRTKKQIEEDIREVEADVSDELSYMRGLTVKIMDIQDAKSYAHDRLLKKEKRLNKLRIELDKFNQNTH